MFRQSLNHRVKISLKVKGFFCLIFVLLFSTSYGQSFSDTTSGPSFYGMFTTDFYRSYSQMKTSLPMKMGYPVFQAVVPGIGLGREWHKNKNEHQVSLKAFFSPYLTANDLYYTEL